MINELSQIESMIRAEQARQNGRFIPDVHLDDYIKKIKDNAEFVTCSVTGELAAFIAFYCNDPNKNISFISMVLTKPKYRGKKFTKCLLNAVVNLVRERGFDVCQLEVRNQNSEAISLYQKNGFSFIKNLENSQLMQKNLN